MIVHEELTKCLAGKRIRSVISEPESLGWIEGDLIMCFDDNTQLRIELCGDGQIAMRASVEDEETVLR